jgi:hypothetical protein
MAKKKPTKKSLAKKSSKPAKPSRTKTKAPTPTTPARRKRRGGDGNIDLPPGGNDSGN